MIGLQRFLHPTTIGLEPEFSHLREFMLSLPERFAHQEGTLIHNGRNQLRMFVYEGTEYVVKSYQIPIFINRLVYGFLRASKGERSLRNARQLMKIGIGSPRPVGFLNVRNGILFTHSYMVTVRSGCPYRYDMLLSKRFSCLEKICREIGRCTAIMHEHGMYNMDYSRGNILFGIKSDGDVFLEMVDLNRIRFGKISLQKGCRNFDRLPATAQMHRWMAEEYARVRHFSPEDCYREIRHYRLLQDTTEDHSMEELYLDK